VLYTSGLFPQIKKRSKKKEIRQNMRKVGLEKVVSHYEILLNGTGESSFKILGLSGELEMCSW
jgi:hypothetical protein